MLDLLVHVIVYPRNDPVSTMVYVIIELLIFAHGHLFPEAAQRSGTPMNSTVIRWQSAIAHTGVILWQVYSAATAWRSGVVLEKVLSGMGATVGPGVTLFLLTCRWWLIVPIASAFLSIIAIRAIETRPRCAISALPGEVIAALVMNIWWRDAWFG